MEAIDIIIVHHHAALHESRNVSPRRSGGRLRSPFHVCGLLYERETQLLMNGRDSRMRENGVLQRSVSAA